jgi:Fic family protein
MRFDLYSLSFILPYSLVLYASRHDHPSAPPLTPFLTTLGNPQARGGEYDYTRGYFWDSAIGETFIKSNLFNRFLYVYTSERYLCNVDLSIIMAFTEVQKRYGKKYYYRVITYREGKKVKNKKIYLGVNLNKKDLSEAESKADGELGVLNALLTHDELLELEIIRKKHLKQPKATFKNRYETFVSAFTHDSTAIEGNTLSLQETAGLLFDEIIPSAKPLREVNEVLNHRKAFDLVLEYKGDITRNFILELHKLVMKDTLKPEQNSQLGRFRSVQVYIRGVDWIPPAPEDVPKDIKNLLSWYTKNRKKLHPIVTAAYFHVGFEIIHPFVDGNGRVGRLLMNFILHKNGYPMINIPLEKRFDYYDCLKAAQVNGALRPFIDLLLDLLKKGQLMF